MEWWERAAAEEEAKGGDAAQALRLYARADVAAEAVASCLRRRVADSAMGLSPGDGKEALQLPSHSTLQPSSR